MFYSICSAHLINCGWAHTKQSTGLYITYNDFDSTHTRRFSSSDNRHTQMSTNINKYIWLKATAKLSKILPLNSHKMPWAHSLGLSFFYLSHSHSLARSLFKHRHLSTIGHAINSFSVELAGKQFFR